MQRNAGKDKQRSEEGTKQRNRRKIGEVKNRQENLDFYSHIMKSLMQLESGH